MIILNIILGLKEKQEAADGDEAEDNLRRCPAVFVDQQPHERVEEIVD